MKAPEPCPYCGVRVDLYPETRNLGVQVECANCGVRGPLRQTMEQAVVAFDLMPRRMHVRNALEKYGTHKDCSKGCKTGDNRDGPWGTDENGVEYTTDPYRYGCTCGLWAMAAALRSECCSVEGG